VLMASAAAAMIMANSPLADLYAKLIDTPVEVRIGSLELAKPLLLWINDGLMAIFFFIIGLELKREMLEGELADRRSSDGVAGTRIRSFLGRLGYEAKTLGLREGLGSEVPSDASVVLLLGPVDPLLREEVESLRRYLKDGGRLLLALDPGQSANVGDLLAELGLAYHEAVLVNEQYHLRRRFNRSDRQVLYTGSFSSHPSIANLGLDPWGRFALVPVDPSVLRLRAAATRL